MKDLKDGDFVTPIILDPRSKSFTKGKHYEAYNVLEGIFYVKDDNGKSKAIYDSSKRIMFKKVDKVKKLIDLPLAELEIMRKQCHWVDDDMNYTIYSVEERVKWGNRLDVIEKAIDDKVEEMFKNCGL